jgi:heme/copper-type cytochrome/quinol oxidase subunit 2
VLDLVVGVIGVLALGAAYGSGFGVVDTSGTSTASPLSGGAALAALVALAVVAIGVLALLIYSYSKWRDGANDLKRAAGEFGARTAAVAIGVREDLGRATKMFVLAFVSSIVGAIAVVAVVLGAVFSSLSNLNNTTKVPTTTDHSTTLSSAVQAEVRIVVVLIVIVTTVLSILLYAYATRSHVNTIAPFASAETLARAVSGRSFAILGAILVFADVAEFFVPYGAFLGLASTAFLVYGYYQIRGAFDEVLSKPLAPNLSARPVDHLLF